MARRCAVCHHPEAKAIDRVLVQPRPPLHELATRYGIATSSLQRHRSNHLAQKITTAAQERSEGGESGPALLDRLEDLCRRAGGLLDAAEGSGDIRGATSALKELRNTLESLGRLTGAVTGPSVTVNITSTQTWIAIQGSIMQALAPFPEARLAVVAALEHVSDG